MKKYTLLTLAPVLALMAVGCSSPVAMQSSEYDDMYYSSLDQTTFTEPVAARATQAPQRYENNNTYEEEPLAEGEVLNPEYSENSITQNYSGDEYYDGREYSPRDNWYRPDYSFVDPHWGMAYTPRRASYAFYDPFYDPFFYDPFYDPFWGGPGFRSGVTISLSYGWGGFYGNPYYGHSRWWPNSYGYGYYNGYHRGFYDGFYAGGYYPYNNWYYDRPVVGRVVSRAQYGPRDSRNTSLTNSAVTTGRPDRNAYSGESTQGVVGRQSRSSRSTVAPADGTQSRSELPSRPSRRTTVEPRQDRSVQPLPSYERSNSRRTREYSPSRSGQRREMPTRTRSSESRPSRSTFESRPSRSMESRPVSTPSRIERSSSSSPASTGSSSGGGRPSRRGNNE